MGPAKSLFHHIDDIFGDEPGVLVKKKLNEQQALKVLQKKFKYDTNQIYGQLEQFRDGTRSLEIYQQQTAASMPKNML